MLPRNRGYNETWPGATSKLRAALCDTLETKLRESELAARKVAEALVAELLQA
ncbi:MAG TPA: hypothetical protein PK156_50610 [Polyangium sp.]|nr:hypothetical protein [Polyangium sp.]